MKTLTFFSFLLLTTINVVAQKPDKALIRVKYSFSHMMDTNQRQNYYTETMLLVAGKDASVFLSYDKILRDAEAKKSFEEQARQQAGNIQMLKSPPRKRQYSDIEYYYFANEDRFFTKEQMGISYLTERKAEKIAWKITSEKQIIEGINCKKATAFFKGRNWNVWFAEDLPFTSGPWRLTGLPGLIIQANDENKEVLFDFAGLEQIDHTQKNTTHNPLDEYSFKKLGSSNFLTDVEIKLPENVVKASVQEIERLKEARANDPQGFAKTQMAAMGFGGITRVAGPGNNPTLAKQPSIFNNPIEKKQPVTENK